MILMHAKKWTIGLTLLCTLNCFAKDITVDNRTDKYGTGYLNYSPCSSKAGDKGIVKPHSSMKMSQSTIETFCGFFSCDARIYASKDCGGSEIAIITLNYDHGVTHIKNLDKEHYSFSGSGSHIKIEPAKENDWLS
jgi:hypothetical protein